MGSLVIELTPEMQERLQSLADKRGVTVSDLVRTALEALTAPQKPGGEPAGASTRPIWEQLVEIANEVPEEELANRPADLAEQHDHYIYGTPKKR
jgi:hypothetical protein